MLDDRDSHPQSAVRSFRLFRGGDAWRLAWHSLVLLVTSVAVAVAIGPFFEALVDRFGLYRPSRAAAEYGGFVVIIPLVLAAPVLRGPRRWMLWFNAVVAWSIQIYMFLAILELVDFNGGRRSRAMYAPVLAAAVTWLVLRACTSPAPKRSR